jgi:hypothetical protein
MKAWRAACMVAGLGLVASAALVAQSDDPRKPDPYINKYVCMMQISTMTDAPYSLERENRGPGSHLGVSTGFVDRYRQYRDSRGWIREEMDEGQPAEEEPSGKLAMVLIFDPVTRNRYWMVNSPIKPSWVLTPTPSTFANDVHGWPAGFGGAPANGAIGEGDKRIEFMTVSLGSDTMLGLHVEGIRQTGTRANGEKMYEVEGWFSPDLQLPILVKSDDKNGHVERRVTKIERGEPDASLFVPPTDYKTVTPANAGKQAAGSAQ